jgi:threonine dehydrogenase-like Zn-dependent dehydrogenase
VYIRKALEAISRGDVRATDLITGEEPLSRLPQLMRDMVNRNGNIKTAIIP